MTKELIKQHIQSKVLGRVTPKSLMRWEVKHDVESAPNYIRHKISVTVGSVIEGPAVHSDEMIEEVIKEITHEIYSETLNDLRELRKILFKEQFRGINDPVMEKLHSIMSKLTP